jgi:polyhydroxyalkanoate synthesis regulator phasin
MHKIAQIGDNNPPSPFDEIKSRIDDLYNEAKLWLDGEPVTTQEQANALNTLENRIREAAKEAETLRKSEVKPLDEAKAEIQERFNALIGETKTVTGKTVMAISTIKSFLKPCAASSSGKGYA